MINLNPNDLERKELANILTNSIKPRPIALVTTTNENDSINIAPFSYFNIVSDDLGLIMISVQTDNKKRKDTSYNIINNKEAIIHLVDEKIIYDMNETSINYEYNLSEINRTKFNLVPTTLKTLGLKESLIKYDCVLYNHIPIYKEDYITTDLFVLQIKNINIDESILDESYHINNNFQPVSRLEGNNYLVNNNILSIKRPKWFISILRKMMN